MDIKKLYDIFNADSEITAWIDEANYTLVLNVHDNSGKAQAIEKIIDCPVWAPEGTSRVVVIDEQAEEQDWDKLVEIAFKGNDKRDEFLNNFN